MQNIDRIIPLLVYEDIPAAHDFLVNVLGFVPGGVQRDADGLAVHGEVHLGDLTIWLHRASDELKLLSPRSLPAVSSGLVIHIKDVDAHCKHARAHGAKVEGEPKDMPYGQREYGVTDPEGHRWWFASPLSQ